MRLKITSQHKAEGNLSVSNFFVSISEFYINVNSGTVDLRTAVFTESEELDENSNVILKEYPLRLMQSDPLYSCLQQSRSILEWATDQTEIQLNGTRYNVQAALLFELIFGKINEVNSNEANKIVYTVIGF
jgi:hypothetical protein